jgi:hypothetical protein
MEPLKNIKNFALIKTDSVAPAQGWRLRPWSHPVYLERFVAVFQRFLNY